MSQIRLSNPVRNPNNLYRIYPSIHLSQHEGNKRNKSNQIKIQKLTRRNKQRESLHGILMRRLHPPDLLQSTLTQFARPHRRVAVLGEVFPRRRVVVDAEGDFGKARAERAVGEEPVCDREGGGVVGWLLGTGGLEGAMSRVWVWGWFDLGLLVKMRASVCDEGVMK